LPQKRHAPTSTFKKVIVVQLDGKSHAGYVDPGHLGQTDGIDLLTIEGEHEAVSLGAVKGVYFVREFGEPFEPTRKAFLSRPRQEGLWVRLLFVDRDQMEGLVPNDLLSLLERGIYVTPPDSHGNSLRLYVPRMALKEFRVLGVVGAARRTRDQVLAGSPQGNLFENGS
jgi:Family of unknown function (DUF6982)